jgi:hypothetical protein
MKIHVRHLLFCFALVTSFQVSAQYCGSSQVRLGFGACTIQGTPGFGNVNTYHCITKGQCDTLVIPFQIYTGFTAAGNTITIYKLRIDAIDSLPCGLCWSTTQSQTAGYGPNEFGPGESGCIQIAGLTNDPAGSYKLSMSLAVRDNPSTTGYDIDTIASDAGNVVLWVKVIDPGTSCPTTVDTAHRQHPSTSCTHSSCLTGIVEVSKTLTDLSIQPNPMSSEARVTFNSEITGNQQLRITNLVGSEVYYANLAVKAGANETTIKRNNLPAGIYILSVGGNQGMATRKFIITE